MDVIRGTSAPRRGRRWWVRRPELRLVRDTQDPQTREDPYLLLMIASFGLFFLAFAMFMGAWIGG